MNANEEFEIVGELYQRRFWKLRPGKSVSPLAGYNSSDEDNVAQYKAWRNSDQAFYDAIDQIHRLNEKIRELERDAP